MNYSNNNHSNSYSNSNSENSIEPQPQLLSQEISSPQYQQQLTQEEEEEDAMINIKETSIIDHPSYNQSQQSNPHNNFNKIPQNEKYSNLIPHTNPPELIKPFQDIISFEKSNKNLKEKSKAITNNKLQSQPYPNNKFNLKPKNLNTLPSSSSSQRNTIQPHINDIQQLTYNFQKELSHITISKQEHFMDRMSFDIYKRHTKEQKITQLIDKNKLRLNENNRLIAFNRLIEDANRRLDVKEHLEENKTKLHEEHFFDQKLKKYKENEWKEIYQERFSKFQNEKDKKQIEKVKTKQDLERKNEEEIIDLCKVSKAPMRVIQENSQRMYNDALKKRIIKNEQIAMKEKIEKNDNKFKKIDSLKCQQENQQKMKKNIKELIKDDDEEENDLRSVPNPICPTEDNINYNKKKGNNNIQSHKVNMRMQLNKNKDKDENNNHSKSTRINEKDFFSPGGRLHCDEREAEHIVNEFFTNKLLKR